MWEAEICSQEVQQWERRIWKQTSLKGKFCGRANQAGKAEVKKPEKAFSVPPPSQGTFEPEILWKCTFLLFLRGDKDNC